jgi:predicted lysophospholipase L1 biosynthesis ABC-type transport system permease subunit
MFTLFSRIFLSNWKSLFLLFFIILIASTGFLTLRQITTNIEKSVASETRPLFGADIVVSPRGYASGDILPLVASALSGEVYQAAERREFSTTLFDTSGKTGLVQVVAYSGSYPQRGILILEGPQSPGGIVVTPGLREKFSSG